MLKSEVVTEQKTILIVEDEVSLCVLMQEELTTHGFKVVTAGDGVEGLKRLQDHEPDLIICDRAMPAMTGYELLERIRGVYPQYRAVPFIFLTALTDQRDRQAVQGLQPTAYLEKPLDFDVLLRTIESALSE
ncbi:MAG: response regulator [Rhodospirillales bacterium]|nr:response regulator [Rhodospirillales bacterium]